METLRLADIHAGMQTEWKAGKKAGKQAGRQVGKQTERQTCMPVGKHMQVGILADWQTGRQSRRQID